MMLTKDRKIRMLNLYYDPIYTEGLDPTVRFPRERYKLLATRLTARC